MGAQLGNDGGFSDINMTPLIDIVLVVLIIMMVNIPIQIEQMGVKVPGRPTDTPPPPGNDQLVVALYQDGKMALNRIAMGEQELKYELQRRLRPMAEKRVFVDADGNLEYGSVITAVDLAYEAGAAKVGLAKLKDSGPAPYLGVGDGSGIPRGIHFGSPVIRGTDEAKIDEVKADAGLQAIKGKLNGCYATRLAARPNLSGSYNVIIEVGPDGSQLSEPNIESDSVDDPELKECVNAVLPAVKLSPLGSQQTAAIRYSLLFSPGS